MSLTETFCVTYADEMHKRYAELCLAYGFDLIVSASLLVGGTFTHPTKGHIVRIDCDAQTPDDFEPTLMIFQRENYTKVGNRAWTTKNDYDIPIYPDHYSEIEWAWISRPMEDGSEVTDFEALSRELYIWFKVRPRSMNTMVQHTPPTA